MHLPLRSPWFSNNSIFVLLKQVKCSASLYHYWNVTQPHPQVFSVNGLIIWQFAARLTSSVHTSQTSSKFGRQYLVMMDYAWNFSQSEMAKYFEWILISNSWIRLSYHLKNYGDRGGCYRPRRKTPTEIFIILQMIRKPNSRIVLLFIQNNSPPSMLTSSR